MPFLVKPAQSTIISGIIGSALLLAQNTHWSKEPESFRGAKLLASEPEVRSKLKMDNCINRDNSEKTCFFFFNIASAQISSVAIFQRDALVDVNGVFSQANFNTVLDVFTEAYGTPTKNSVLVLTGADQHRWSGKSVSIRLERLISDERRGNVGAIISSFCEAQRAAVRDMDAFGQNLAKQQDADRRRSGVDTGDRVDAMVRSLKAQEAEHEKNASYAESQCQKFSSVTYGLFSITVNSYAAQVAQRQEDEKRKAADSLK